MKKIIFILLVLGSVLVTFSQKSVYKIMDFSGDFIQINLGKIDHLKLIQSTENKVIISSNELQEEASFLKIRQEKKGLFIQTVQTKMIKEELPACIEQPLFTSYTIQIPKNIKVFVTIKSGNFLTSHFTGFLELFVDEGEIVLKEISGKVNVKNIDGIVTCTTDIQNISTKSHLGKVFLKKRKNSRKANLAKEVLIIESIRGNIFVNTGKMP